jgi:hypothetical protein
MFISISKKKNPNSSMGTLNNRIPRMCSFSERMTGNEYKNTLNKKNGITAIPYET